MPISGTLDTAGPMARTVRDAAILLGALKGNMGIMNHYYRYGFVHYEHEYTDYTQGLERANLRGLRIGIYGDNEKENNEKEDKEFSDALSLALDELENAGAFITRNIPSITKEKPWDYFGNSIAKHEFKRAIASYLACGGSTFSSFGTCISINSLKDLVDFNEAHKNECLKYGQTILLECLNEYSGNLTEAEYINALRRRETAISDLNKVFDENNLDILIGAHEHISIAPLTGFPSGTLPIGIREKTNGVPLGMYFIARRHDEATLIQAMSAAEKVVGKRQMPK